MQTRTQRGRVVPKKTQPMRAFYIALAVIAIIGVAVIAITSQHASSTSVGNTAESLDSYQSKGNADAPVTVIEYADFQCPGCAAFATTQEPQFTRDYIDTGKVRLIYHEFPLTQIHPNAVISAEAGRCAADQGAFWPMHDLLFQNQDAWANQTQPTQLFITYAAQLKLDQNTFSQCLANGIHRAEILTAEQQSMAAQIPSTPSFVIDGKRYDASQLQSAVNAALATHK